MGKLIEQKILRAKQNTYEKMLKILSCRETQTKTTWSFPPLYSRGYLEGNKGYKAGEGLGQSEAGRGWGEEGVEMGGRLIHCCWECRLVQLLCKYRVVVIQKAKNRSME